MTRSIRRLLLLSALAPLLFTAPAFAQEEKEAACGCVTCYEVGKTPVANEYAYCGDKKLAEGFATRIDGDGSKDGVICTVVSPQGACPEVPMPESHSGKSFCNLEKGANCDNRQAFDAYGVGCSTQCCGPDGCVPSSMKVFGSFTPYHKVPVATVPDAERDRYFAEKALHGKSVRDNEPEYVGPEFCLAQAAGNPQGYDTCRDVDKVTTVKYGKDSATLTIKEGMSMPRTLEVPYKDLGASGERYVPYGAR